MTTPVQHASTHTAAARPRRDDRTGVRVLWLVWLITAACPVPGPAEEATWRVGLQAESVHYQEPGVMKEEGFLVGPFAEVTLAEYGRVDFRLFGSRVTGATDYESDEKGTGIDVHSRNPGRIADLRLEAACHVSQAPVVARLFTGTGYRRLDDDVRGPPGYVGYTRVQHYFYIPAGLTGVLLSHDRWRLAGTVEYDLFVAGRNETFGAHLRQDSGYGCRASLLFDWRTTAACITRAQVEPFMQYWDIDRSSLDRNTYEPDNHSTLFGLRIAILF